MSLPRSRLLLLLLGLLVSVILYLLLPAIRQGLNEPSLEIRKMETTDNGKQLEANITIRTGKVTGDSTFYREALLSGKDGSTKKSRFEVVFLHGQSFTSKTWEDLGTMTLLSLHGYRTVALDLPGYGESPDSELVKTDKGRIDFLLHTMKTLEIKNPVLISPSMSGHFSLPFLMQHSEKIKGFVPIAPTGTKNYTTDQYSKIKTPTLIVYGELDTNLGTQSLMNLSGLPHHSIVALAGAKHACYLDKPKEFHEALMGFLGKLEKTEYEK